MNIPGLYSALDDALAAAATSNVNAVIKQVHAVAYTTDCGRWDQQKMVILHARL
jgi:hypothetical protein